MTKPNEPGVTIKNTLASGEDPDDIPSESLPTDSDSVEFPSATPTSLYSGFPKGVVGFADKFTISSWCKRVDPSTLNNHRPLHIGDPDFVGNSVIPRQRSGGQTFFCNVIDGGGSNIYAGAAAIDYYPADEWVQFVWSFDHTNGVGGTTTIHRNGVKDAVFPSATNALTITDAGRLISISGEISVIPVPFEIVLTDPLLGWRVFDCAIWNVALSDAEAVTLYNGGKPANFGENFGNYTSAASLRHYYRLAYNLKPEISRPIGFDDGTLPIELDTLFGGPLSIVTDSPGRS